MFRLVASAMCLVACTLREIACREKQKQGSRVQVECGRLDYNKKVVPVFAGISYSYRQGSTVCVSTEPPRSPSAAHSMQRDGSTVTRHSSSPFNTLDRSFCDGDGPRTATAPRTLGVSGLVNQPTW